MADDSLPIKGLVLVTERQQWGATVYVPANDLARALVPLWGGAVITTHQLPYVKRLGLTVRTAGVTSREL